MRERDMNVYIAYIGKRIYRYKNYAYRVFHFQMYSEKKDRIIYYHIAVIKIKIEDILLI